MSNFIEKSRAAIYYGERTKYFVMYLTLYSFISQFIIRIGMEKLANQELDYLSQFLESSIFSIIFVMSFWFISKKAEKKEQTN